MSGPCLCVLCVSECPLISLVSDRSFAGQLVRESAHFCLFLSCSFSSFLLLLCLVLRLLLRRCLQQRCCLQLCCYGTHPPQDLAALARGGGGGQSQQSQPASRASGGSRASRVSRVSGASRASRWMGVQQSRDVTVSSSKEAVDKVGK